VIDASLAIPSYAPGGSSDKCRGNSAAFRINSAVIVRGLGGGTDARKRRTDQRCWLLICAKVTLPRWHTCATHIRLPDAITAIGRVTAARAYTASPLPIFNVGLDRVTGSLAAANSALIDGVFHSALPASAGRHARA
jgi:hypothetical protein